MKHSTWRQLVLLFFVAFLLRLAAGAVWQSRLDGRFAMGDSESYWQLAQTIVEGRTYVYGEQRARVFRTPGYPLLLAPIFLVADDGPTAVYLARAEAALFGALAVLAVWWIALLLFDRRAAWIAALSTAFYPGAIVLSVLVLSEAPFCPLMLLQLGLCILAWNAETVRRRAGWGFAAGLAGGAATLMRPSWLLFTPLAAGILLLLQRCNNSWRLTASGSRENAWPHFPQRILIAFNMILGLAVAMAPWWIRNAKLTGRFVPTTIQVGASLYDGLNPSADGSSNMAFVERFIAEQRLKDDPGEAPSVEFERRLDIRMRDEALAWTKANSGRAARLAGKKFLRMWNIWPNERSFSAWPARLAVFFTYTPLLFFAIIGACRTFRRGWPYILCWLPAVYLTALHVVFVSSIRYREPAMLALLALAAGEIGYWVSGLGSRR
ncbi:MAG: glycosyltransferase family 39 protein [Pirellulales bacterium]|nr:glycosyltransferase family 39 protein [Pirellulales bacterium]